MNPEIFFKKKEREKIKMKVRDIINYLQNNYLLDETIAFEAWTIDDVKRRAEETNKPIPSNEDCEKILDSLEDSYDAEIGLNWESIDFYL